MDNRNVLEFKETVAKVFGDLQKKYKLNIRTSSNYEVFYQNYNIYLYFFHDRLSYEISFEIGENPVSMQNIYKFNSNDLINIYINNGNITGFSATTTSGIKTVMKRIIDLLEKYCSRGLEGDHEYFVMMAKKIKELNQKGIETYKIELINRKLNDFWEKKDFINYKRIFKENMSLINSAIQIKRYEYIVKK